MKRLVALALAIAMICAVFCGCGEEKKKAKKTVSVTVAAKYDEGYAEKYASSTSTDSNGNKTYQFTDDKYEEFTSNYNNNLSARMSSAIVESHNSSSDQAKPYGQFVYIDEAKKAVIVGLMPGQYKEEQAKTEANIASEYAFRYFQNLKTPVNTIKVLFCNANSTNHEEVYGSFEYSIK